MLARCLKIQNSWFKRPDSIWLMRLFTDCWRWTMRLSSILPSSVCCIALPATLLCLINCSGALATILIKPWRLYSIISPRILLNFPSSKAICCETQRRDIQWPFGWSVPTKRQLGSWIWRPLLRTCSTRSWITLRRWCHTVPSICSSSSLARLGGR